MQIRRGREADTERLVALAGQIFETEQEIPRALTPLPPENRPQWWCVEEDGALLGGVALYWEDDAWHMGRFVIPPELRGRHVGTALLETALTDIFAQDIREVTMEARDTTVHILKKFGYSEHDIELARIAGYMHDIGNAINRTHHAEYGALLANDLLKDTDMSLEDRITVISAIGNHDESTGSPEDVISAALIIADKTDVRRSRVRQKEKSAFDIHDRVNYAVTDSKLKIAEDKSAIALNLQIDEKICSMYDYFEIFLGRMMLCRKSAEILGTTLKLTVNGRKVL